LTDAGSAYLGPERLGRPTQAMGSSWFYSEQARRVIWPPSELSSLGPHLDVGEPVSVDVPHDPKIHAPPNYGAELLRIRSVA